MEHRHIPGKLKQQNKPHKAKFSTKGSLKTVLKGKVETNVRTNLKNTKINATESKEDRRQKAKQMQQAKKLAKLNEKRLGKRNFAPKVIGIIPFSKSASTATIKKFIEESQDLSPSNDPIRNISLPEFKTNISLFESKRTIKSILDAAKIADNLIVTIDINEGIDEEGKTYLSCLRAQGVPEMIFAIQGLAQIPTKKQKDMKRDIVNAIEKEFSNVEQRIVHVDNIQDGKLLCRWISEHKVKRLGWREVHPYLIADKWNFQPSGNDVGFLTVSGYLRGNDLSPNMLIYIPKFGHFQVEQISYKEQEMGEKEMTTEVVLKPDQTQEDMISEMIPDTINNEQTWPTDDDFKRPKDKKPKGMIIEESTIGEHDDDDEDVEVGDEEDQDLEDFEDEMEEELEETKSRISHRSLKSEVQTQIDTKYDLRDDDMTNEQREEERQAFLKRLKESRDEVEFPDEVEVNPEEPARIRFQKYRGLKSFRTSPWDPKENLPLDYAKIFQFGNFAQTQKNVLKKLRGCTAGEYYTITLKNVPSLFVQRYQNEILILFGLLKHEQKISMMHFQVKKSIFYSDPIRSKDELFAQIGFRTFKCNPIFSEYNPRFAKHKFEKFLPDDGFACASFYCPVTYSPCPILFFKKDSLTGRIRMVACGTSLGADPDRVIVKKVILTGHPYKTHKKQAVIRFMFFNQDDVKWFKPVELWTKYGRNGVIKEPIGTHGNMKCSFDDILGGNDTVCMSLYKRMFPKWNTEPVSFE